MRIQSILDAPAKVSLKQLVWTASVLPRVVMARPCKWLEIEVVYKGSFSHQDTGMKKVVLRTADDLV
jgi:hypothetical protein